MSTRLQLKDLNLKPYITTGTASNFNIVVERINSYDDKEVFFIDFHTSCGNNAKLNINGLGAKNITIGFSNVTAGKIVGGYSYFLKYDVITDTFMVVGGGGGGGSWSCADVKNCIENFTDLDLSNLETLILGGPSTDIYINGSTLYYDSVTFNYSGTNYIAYEDGTVINHEGEVTNNYEEYTENNVYGDNVEYNYEGEVTNNYEDYTEHNVYDDNSVVINEGGTHIYEGDVVIEGDIIHSGGNLILKGAAHIEHFTATDGQTEFVLSKVPTGPEWIWVSSQSSLYSKQGLNYDYEYDVDENKIVLMSPAEANDVITVQYVVMAIDNTMNSGEAYIEHFEVTNLLETEFELANRPAGAAWVWVSNRSSLYSKQGAFFDYVYDPVNNKIVLNDTPIIGDKFMVQYIGGLVPNEGKLTPIVPEGNVLNSYFGQYILVTGGTNPTTINLPDATYVQGGQIKVKKFTGEDVQVITIMPKSGQLIDGYTGATMNINRTMYTFTAIDGNWYLGD